MGINFGGSNIGGEICIVNGIRASTGESRCVDDVKTCRDGPIIRKPGVGMMLGLPR